MPTYRKTSQAQQNQIRFKNLMREAEMMLREVGSREERDLLDAPNRLLEDKPFWQNQCEGLAVFVSQGFFKYYCVPVALSEEVVVADRFHVKPLLPLLIGDGRFYILALSQNQVRLLQCTRDNFASVELAGIPQSLDEALKYDDIERQVEASSGSSGRAGSRGVVFHAQGVGEGDTKENILRYFKQIDKGLQRLLPGERAPLVVAGVDYLFPIYREANTFPSLLDQAISGNPEGLRAEELHRQAWEIVEPEFLSGEMSAAELYEQLAGTGRSSDAIEEVVNAAYHGRVDTVFVAVGVNLWGAFDPSTGKVLLDEEHAPGNEDLLDLAAVHTLLKGGTVYAVQPDQVPAGGALAAIFRY